MHMCPSVVQQRFWVYGTFSVATILFSPHSYICPTFPLQARQATVAMSTQSNENDTIALRYDETGYGPGDGFIYFIQSASGKSKIRRLGLTHMSDAWKEHMLAHYEFKRPARKPRRQVEVKNMFRRYAC